MKFFSKNQKKRKKISLRQLSTLTRYSSHLQDHTMPMKCRCNNRRELQKKPFSCSCPSQVQAWGDLELNGYWVRVATSRGKAMCTRTALSMLEKVICFSFFNRASVEGRRRLMIYTKHVLIPLFLRKVSTACITPHRVRLCIAWIWKAKLSPY